MTIMQNTRSTIYIDHLRHNIDAIRTFIPATTEICLAVKANAYGHGAPETTKAAEKAGIRWFGVANTDEGIELREAGITSRIILFSLALPADIPRFIKHNITPVVADRGFLPLLERHLPLNTPSALPYPVHLIIDTGMGRIGCPPEEARSLAEAIVSSPKLNLEGTCTHFAQADAADLSFSREQLKVFLNCIAELRKRGIDPGILHAANSGAIIGLPASHLDMVRPGIMAYGYYPSKEQERKVPLKPVMEFASNVVFIKEVGPNSPISYGSTFRTKQATRIATVAAGYGDGYFRKLSNRGKVCIRGKLYPVAGRVTMDQIMVDIGQDSDVRLYDPAVLFGPDPEALSAEDIADLCETIPYEVTCAISKRVLREYKEHGND